jgi:hypothetical protein
VSAPSILRCYTRRPRTVRLTADLPLGFTPPRPTKASFTSLSTRIGEIVGELHLKLAALLSSPAMLANKDLALGLLGVAQVLGLNGPYGRLKRPLALPLCEAIRPLLRSEGWTWHSTSRRDR